MPELTDQQKSGLQRLVEDEDVMEAIKAVCDITAAEYKDVAYRYAVTTAPDLAVITSAAGKAYAFENVAPILLARYKEEFESEEKESNG